MRVSIARLAAPFAALLATSGCNYQPPLDVEPIQTKIPHVETGAELAPFALEEVKFAITRGTQIGAYKMVPFMCEGRPPAGGLQWRTGPMNVDPREFADATVDEFRNANFRVLGDPKELSRGREERPLFLLGARILSLKMNICEHTNLVTGHPVGLQTGEANATVEWQLFSVIEHRTVLTQKTQGYFSIDKPTGGGITSLTIGAFAAAALNLAAEPAFVEQLRMTNLQSTAQSATVSAAPMILARLPELREPINATMARARAATVVIELSNGHGSGFFISRNGYLLTNYHVVGDAEIVRVRYQGIALTGRVVRTNKMRDVVLVKLDVMDAPALPIRLRAPEIGEDVYAVGAPQDMRLASTVTKGIVSALRPFGAGGTPYGDPMIQADVTIQGGSSGGPLLDAHGNVIGIAAEGRVADPRTRASIGLNFFIPIEDALTKLNLKFGGPV